MEFSEIIEKLRNEFSITNAVKINKEDGEVIESIGNQNVLLNDIGAFIGSAGEIISKKVNMKSPQFTFLKTNTNNVAIINQKDDFIAFEITGKVSSLSVFNKYKEIIMTVEVETADVGGEGIDDLMDIASSMEVEENKLGEIERKLLNAKIIQLNYLVEEFSSGGDNTKWIDSIKQKIEEMELLKQAIDFDDKINIKNNVPVEISREDIQKNAKILIDTVCKVAVQEFGAAEAKKKVQNVILKLNKK